MTEQYELRPFGPSLEHYLRLRRDSGLQPKTPEQGIGALAHSWAWAHIVDVATDEPVAMGRILGDDGWYFVVADMATDPAHQRRGLGRRILDHLIAEVRMRAPAGAFLTLAADVPGRPLYRAAGFEESAPESIAMHMILD